MPVLVRCGGSVSAEDDEGRTPAYLALLYACTPAAAALLAFPQSLEHTTKVGQYFFWCIVMMHDVENTLESKLFARGLFSCVNTHVVLFLGFLCNKLMSYMPQQIVHKGRS